VVDHIKAFGKVKEAKKSEILAVGGSKNVVGYGEKRGFSGQEGAETVLGLGKKVVVGHIRVQLLLGSLLHKFGEGRNDRNGAKVGGVAGVTGFVDGMYDGVLPGCGKLTGCDTGVDKMKKDMANGVKTHLKNPDANTVRTTGC